MKAAEARLRAYLAAMWQEPTEEEIVAAFDRPWSAVWTGLRQAVARPSLLLGLVAAVLAGAALVVVGVVVR